ncbi:hypothetical protein M407DRAFT_216245 [Tulasnella calospora MUT 4182]|uniref:Uncharacterized protein n=1 Tax=Tulasnella calospora MUT 4182 TaxID=1051891 RepID=A0A0C3QBP8_9AGAM|nr:hypothetical protein M407DRAFT_216245 [Tulasnella calospora MUT 4182]
MFSEPSRHDVQEQPMNAFQPKPPVEGDENQREERESKPSSGAELPINHPADTTNPTSAAINSSSKSGSGQSWWSPFGGGEQISPMERHNRELQSQVEHLTRTLNSREKDIRGLESRVEHFSRTLSSKEKAHREELAEKDSELAELKKTLCMYDECSEVEIGNMVDGINTRIQSLARHLAVRSVKGASKASDRGENETMVSAAHVERLRGVIGVPLLNALDGASLGQTTFTAMFLQLAWQASIVDVVQKIISCFSASLARSQDGSQIESALWSVAEAVREGEVQPAYGRWRLVTHRYLRQLLESNDEAAIQAYVNEAHELCQTAGRLAMKNRCPDGESFRNTLQPQTREIVEEAFKLLTTIQEKMVTANYEPYIRPNGRPFRSDKMNLSKQDKEYPNDHVVCTTGFGMLYSRRTGRELTSESRMHIFKKPQVLTEANLHDMVAG